MVYFMALSSSIAFPDSVGNPALFVVFGVIGAVSDGLSDGEGFLQLIGIDRIKGGGSPCLLIIVGGNLHKTREKLPYAFAGLGIIVFCVGGGVFRENQDIVALQHGLCRLLHGADNPADIAAVYGDRVVRRKRPDDRHGAELCERLCAAEKEDFGERSPIHMVYDKLSVDHPVVNPWTKIDGHIDYGGKGP